MVAAKRSRTGCATCRTRKLKCDETKPICGQCEKSKKTCVASEGIAFRHEQNAGINTDLTGNRSLEGFFKDRYQYTEEDRKNFVPLPATLEWRYVTDVYAEDIEHHNTPRNAASPQAYQREMASGGLEALSTAAAENQSYQPPVTYADINNLYQGPHGGYGPVSGPNQNHNIKFLLNPSNTPAAMIDPNLDTTALENVTQAAERSVNEANGSTHGPDHKDDDDHDANHDVTNEEHNLLLLKHYDEQAI